MALLRNVIQPFKIRLRFDSFDRMQRSKALELARKLSTGPTSEMELLYVSNTAESVKLELPEVGFLMH